MTTERELTGSPALTSVLIGIAATTVALLARGVAYGIDDHSFLIPIIRHLAQPEAYAGDYLFTALQGYSTLFYVLVAAMQLSESGLAVFFVVSTILIAFGILALVSLYALQHGCLRTEALLITLALALGYNPSLGRSWFDLHLSHALPGILLGVTAVFLFMKRRYYLSFIFLGLMLNIHGMYALTVFTILILASFLESPTPWKRLLIGPLITLAFGLPILILQLQASSVPFSMGSWLEVLHARSGHHIFLSHIRFVYWVQFLTFIGVITRPWRAPHTPLRWHRLTSSAALVAATGILAAILFTDLFPIQLAVRLQPLRATFWLFIISLPLMARSVREAGDAPDLAAPVAIALVVTSLLCQPLSLKVLALGYVVASHLLRPFNTDRGLRVVSLAYILAVGVTCFGRILMESLGAPVPSFWPLAGSHTILILLVLLASWGLGARPVRLAYPSGLPMVLMATVVLFFSVEGLIARQGSVLRTSPREWQDVQTWARQHTAPGSTFVVPIYLEGFRIGSWRNLYVDWKDGTLSNFSPEFAALWWRRMASLGARFDQWADPQRARFAYGLLGSTDICEVARHVAVEYFITEDRAQASELPLVYSNERFHVRRIACGSSSHKSGVLRLEQVIWDLREPSSEKALL